MDKRSSERIDSAQDTPGTSIIPFSYVQMGKVAGESISDSLGDIRRYKHSRGTACTVHAV